MNLSIPIYIESSKSAGVVVYHGRPLFFATPAVQNEKVDRVMTRLAQDIGKALTQLGREPRHDQLARWTFAPRLGQHRLDLSLELRRSTVRCRFLFVVFRQFGRRIGFTPSFPDLWFDIGRKEVLRDRATEVLTRHLREREREEPEFDPTVLSLTGTAYVTPLEVTIHPPSIPPEKPAISFLMLGNEQPPDGAEELRRVGRCLDWQFPEELDRVTLRETEIKELTRLLDSGEDRPVLLIGPRQVGKTALVHEYVYRKVAAHRSPYRDRENVWLLAPGRLIAGMSYVGQWENRVLALLKEARRRRHILYFDDLLGLFQAGKTGKSSLHVATVLKPYLERRDVRLLAEITPEAWRVLRELDRSFADLFHVLPVKETSEAETLRILINVQRQLETQQRCWFNLEVLPTVLDLQRRYARDCAFPGKAATFFRQLAAKHRGTAEGKIVSLRGERRPQTLDPSITREDVLKEYHARSGLTMTFLDQQIRLERQTVIAHLCKGIVGQDAALRAAADVIAIAKARLNDPGRPLASFLFLGPTGVGKTQCARALAAFLFGDADRMLRFDLNEYGDPGSAARLVGTHGQPEGLLTSAIRRQPFAVVLLDEVEKAHPEVFDLLLQVLGEGRLTDALGRTADFGNAIIILTSNLGVREAEGGLGYRQDDVEREAVFVRAAEQFFRPEFFNRLDRILPFHRLTRDHVRQIAHRLIGDVFSREGVIQRKCVVQIEEQAMERLVDQGFDPVLGARALKRGIERHLTGPLAVQLAALPTGSFTAVQVLAGPKDLVIQVRPLAQLESQAPPALPLDRPGLLIRRIRAALRRIDDELAPLRPAGPIGSGNLDPRQMRYFTLRDQISTLRAQERELAERFEAEQTTRHGLPSFRRPDVARQGVYKRIHHDFRATGDVLREMAAALNINEYLKDLIESGVAIASSGEATELLEMVQQVVLLNLIAESVRQQGPDRVVVCFRGLGLRGEEAAHTLWLLASYVFDGMQLDVSDLWKPAGDADLLPLFESDQPEAPAHPVAIGKARALLVQGPHALSAARLQEGIHLFHPWHGGIEPVQLDVLPVAADADPAAVFEEWQSRRQHWLTELAGGRSSIEQDPMPLGRVVRLYGQNVGMVDLLTGTASRWWEKEQLLTCALTALPLPPELLVE